jgi:lipopolysaccharide/colanic/teichoic acid biosynthesis glycosyltransferase
MSPTGQAVKRAMDVVLAGTALAAGWPFLAALAILIRIDSPGPVFFRQERAGRRMRPFMVYKFRTMRADADPYDVSPMGREDARLTRLGRWLREMTLDELPQLWNVLKGDMSIVGPRPLYMSQARQFDERERRRLEVSPGLTGLAQVLGRGEIPHEEKLELDVQYVERWGLWLDLKIILGSVRLLVPGDRVYQKWT